MLLLRFVATLILLDLATSESLKLNNMTRCWSCTVEKSLDDTTLSIRDETVHQEVDACAEYACMQPGQDRCLVTYFRMSALVAGEEARKLERYECGNKMQRDQDTRCKSLRSDDEDKLLKGCQTKRFNSSTTEPTFTDQPDRPILNIDQNNNFGNGSNYGRTQCLDCTIEKSMDNRALSFRDETLHTYTSQCKMYSCKQNAQDWCLVTHYRMRAFYGGEERKLERHECGNKNQKERDIRCKSLRIDDEQNVIEKCETKRSGAYTIYTSTLPLLASVVFLLLNH